MRRVVLICCVLCSLGASGCCWRPWWCNQQPYGNPQYYGPPVYPQQTCQQPVYQQPMYAPQPGTAPCTCY